MSVKCPALIISAPASGQGKTTTTAALAWHFHKQGLNVRIFKTGADFLDPEILKYASANPVYQLDLWMTGEQHCRELLYDAAKEADLILIEGVMGLYDGNPSTADLAHLFNIPVMAVINAAAMAGTFAAIAHGLASYRNNFQLAGVLANHVGSESHANILRESLPDEIKWYGALSHNKQAALPERHLGILLANEIHDLQQKLELASEMLAQSGLSDIQSIPETRFSLPVKTSALKPLLSGVRIGIARDDAFCFCYQANIDLLSELGAEPVFFSPIHDHVLPDIDSLYLPGGYPELHMQSLQTNHPMREAMATHHNAGKPIIAECGGLLYLLETLTDIEDNSANMCNILPGEATLQKRLTNLSMQSMQLPEGTIRGHSYHHSRINTTLQPAQMTTTNSKYGSAESVFRVNRLLASYMHLYMPSNPEATARLFTP